MGGRFMSNMEIRRFKALMVKKGFVSISALARVMGCRREALSRKINGRSDWSRSEMEAVARLFDENPKKVFFEE